MENYFYPLAFLMRKYCILGPLRWMQYRIFVVALFPEYREQACHGTQKGNPLNQCCGQDHVRPDFAGSFRLTGDGLNGSLADLANADSGTHGGKSGADRTESRLNHIQQNGHQSHASGFYDE
jgi:hypothetical protein